MNLQERLKQNQKNVAALQAQGDALRKQIKEEKEPELGDIAICCDGSRVVLFDKNQNCLRVYNEHGCDVGSLSSFRTGFYKQTGRTIFDSLK